MLFFGIKNQGLLFAGLLAFSALCKPEENAPGKFYDGLQEKAEEISKYHTGKRKKYFHSNNLPSYDEAFDEKNSSAELATNQIQEKSLPDRQSSPTWTVHPSDDKKNFYIVKKNDTLFAIARRFHVSLAQLATLNRLSRPTQVHEGQKLKIFKYKQKHSDFEILENPPEKTKNLTEISEKTSIISTNNKNMLKFYCQWPTEGKIIKNFAQSHGRGIVISGRLGQGIKAIAAGQVVAVSAGIYGHGGFIVIQHNNQYLSSYANNKRALVKNGQTVIQGQVIAEMGKTGRKRPAVELQIRKNGKLVDPMQFLPKRYERHGNG